MNKALTAAVIGLFLVFATAGLATINIETVPVGSPGNAADMRYRLNERPEGYGRVDYDYRSGKYEVTAGQYTEFLNKVAGVDTYALYTMEQFGCDGEKINTGMSDTSLGSGITRSGGGTVDNPYTYSVASDFANRPVNYISWGNAARFANWLHNGQPTGAQNLSTTEDGSYTLNGATTDEALMAVTRKPSATWVIPSEDEWYKAAYYKGGSTNAGYFDYPTRSDTIPGRDMADVSGNNANHYTGPGDYGTIADIIPIDSGKYSTVVGEFQNSASPYGTFDQGGNVSEWNEAILYGGRGLRGGSFVYYFFYGPGYDLIAWAGGESYPAHEFSTFGFRVSRVPEPASMAILALGGLSMLVRRRGVRA
jgi:formylglycine-generating enzyme required for sulfatase activity